MNTSVSTNTAEHARRALAAHAERLRGAHTAALFAADAARLPAFSVTHDGLYFDFSRQRLDAPALAALLDWADAARLPQGIEQLFGGAPLNNTEHRPALHMAMRDDALLPANSDTDWAANRERLLALTDAVRTGQLRGATGEPFEHILALGIGGSELGPRLVCEALATPGANTPQVRFVAGLDPAELTCALADARPERTLVLIASKSWSTLETLENARAVRQWLRSALSEAQLAQHLVAICSVPARAHEFGVAAERIFPLPEWVGGRFSVWSAVGLPAMLAVGSRSFRELLAGAQAMDRHFRHAPFAQNLPVLAALIGLWNIHALGIETHAVLPYAHGLRSLPAWLQQLDMESNGKRVTRDGAPLSGHSAPIVWGGAEPAGQHAFHQLLYQGTRTAALDFLLIGNPQNHPMQRLLAECGIAQAAALMHGRSLDAARALLVQQGKDPALAPHLVCPGNQPSSTLLLPALTAHTLGQLLAFYEHKIFVQGWLWGINSFDQFGVELGKEMARALRNTNHRPDPAATALLTALARSEGKA